MNIRKITSGILVLAVTLIVSGALPNLALAVGITNASDTMSTQATSTAADHVIAWTQGTGHSTALSDTITIDFVQGDFVTSGTWQTTDFSLTDNVGTAAPGAVGTGAASCTGSNTTNYIVDVTAGTSTFKITTCTGWTTTSAASALSFTIKGATGGTGTLTNQSNVDSSQISITNTGTNTDTKTLATVIETNDVVTITATVNPTLTFSNDQSAIAFGTLDSAAVRYANTTTGSGSDVVAHTLTISTNAAAGYTLTYSGATLTSGSNTISVATSIGTGGTPGGEQFAMSTVKTGTGTVVAGYDHTTPLWSWVDTTTTPFASSAGPAASTTYAMHYEANISGATEAGAYSTTATFIASANF
jgi:hypothetical protein